VSTNYEWHPHPERHDDDPEACEEMHIGKQSGAGGGLLSYSMQGHSDTDFGPLDSWAKWKQVMRALPNSVVVDEYGRTLEVEEFIAKVEETTMANRRRQYDWMVAHGYEHMPVGIIPPIDYTGDWLCADGFSFTYSEFS
jgi:hypothetical protein